MTTTTATVNITIEDSKDPIDLFVRGLIIFYDSCSDSINDKEKYFLSKFALYHRNHTSNSNLVDALVEWIAKAPVDNMWILEKFNINGVIAWKRYEMAKAMNDTNNIFEKFNH